MLITDLIAQKRGPLAKVWLAACQERRLSKLQALNVDVEESVDAILTRDEEPIALRLSGQLMLGVVRIYSRKVQYLFDDCKETRERITMAFRPGQVDLAEDQLIAPQAAITFTDERMDMEPLGWNFTAADFVPLGLHTADPSEITLPMNRYRAGSLFGGSSRAGSVDWDSASGFDSQSYDQPGLDLGIDLGDNDSVEVGRDAALALSQRSGSVRSDFGRRATSVLSAKTKSPHRDFDGGLDLDDGGGDVAMDNDFMDGADLGLDLGDNFDGGDDFMMDMPDLQPEEPAEDGRSRRSSTRLTTPPPLSPPQSDADVDMTPRTAARVATAAARAAKSQARLAPAAKRVKLLAVDEEIEMEGDRAGARNRDLSAILGEEHYIVANQTAHQLRVAREDPLAYFLPSITTAAETQFCGGTFGFGSELQGLFLFPSNVLRRPAGQSADAPPAKRPRLESEAAHQDEDVEVGRRQSHVPSDRGADFDKHDDFDRGGDAGGDIEFSNDFDGGFDSYDFDLDPVDNRLLDGAADILAEDKAAKEARAQAKSVLANRSRLGSELSQRSRLTSNGSATPVPEIRPDHALAAFDTRRRTIEGVESQITASSESGSQPLSQTLAFLEDSQEAEAGGAKIAGVSKNTSIALKLLRSELQTVQDEESAGPKQVEFSHLAQKASKRAASAFFFELLVLGTKECVKLEQQGLNRDIGIQAKERLWQSV